VATYQPVISAEKVFFYRDQWDRDHWSVRPGSLITETGITAGLPDGIFSDQKSQFEYIWKELKAKNVVTYSGH
jgi:hypothetical protein